MSAPIEPGRETSTAGSGPDLLAALDVLAGATVVTAVTVTIVARRTARLARGVARLLPLPQVRPPMRPGSGLDSLARLGTEQRHALERNISALLDRLVPAAVDTTLSRIDLTATIAKYVGLDELVASVNLDQAVAGVDIDAIAARIDIDAIIARIDLVGLTEEIMNAIDIPEVIRESTNSVASGGVREVRMQSISADEAVSRIVGRFLLRRQRPPETVAVPALAIDPAALPATEAATQPAAQTATIILPPDPPADLSPDAPVAAADASGTPGRSPSQP